MGYTTHSNGDITINHTILNIINLRFYQQKSKKNWVMNKKVEEKQLEEKSFLSLQLGQSARKASI